MSRWRPFIQLFLARLREFFREPHAVFWVYGFPILLAVGLGIAFWNKKPVPPVVDVQDLGAEATALADHLGKQGMKVELHDEENCRQRLRTGKTALFIAPESKSYRYVFDETREDSQMARYQVDASVQRWKTGPNHWVTEDVRVKEPGTRYIDFLMPGLMGLNLMGGGLWGVGFVLVDMRVRKLLKRLLATPMRRGDFLLSILAARLVFMIPEMVVIFLLGWLVFQVPLQGSFGTLILIIITGSFAFSGVGLLVACRAEKTETVSGLMNLVMLPMWLLSGTFFSSRRFPEVVQPVIQALPLTQLNDALREVMLEGAGLRQLLWRLGILALYGMVTFALALRWFRWT